MARWAPHLIGLLTPISAAVTLLIDWRLVDAYADHLVARAVSVS